MLTLARDRITFSQRGNFTFLRLYLRAFNIFQSWPGSELIAPWCDKSQGLSSPAPLRLEIFDDSPGKKIIWKIFLKSFSGGLPQWTAYPDGLASACALYSQRETSVLVGGLCNNIYELDLTNRGKIQRVIPSGSDGVTIFRNSPSNSRYLYTADNQVLKMNFLTIKSFWSIMRTLCLKSSFFLSDVTLVQFQQIFYPIHSKSSIFFIYKIWSWS